MNSSRLDMPLSPTTHPTILGKFPPAGFPVQSPDGARLPPAARAVANICEVSATNLGQFALAPSLDRRDVEGERSEPYDAAHHDGEPPMSALVPDHGKTLLVEDSRSGLLVLPGAR